MSSSVVPAVIDYLFTTFTAAATLGAAAPPNTVAVFDGPQLSELTPQNALWVGVEDPDGQGGVKAADSASTWLGVQVGQQKREESITIFCAADGWTGSADPGTGVRTARQLAYAITSAVETLLRADLTLGGNVPLPGFAAVSTMGLLQKAASGGMLARVPFIITARTRI